MATATVDAVIGWCSRRAARLVLLLLLLSMVVSIATRPRRAVGPLGARLRPFDHRSEEQPPGESALDTDDAVTG